MTVDGLKRYMDRRFPTKRGSDRELKLHLRRVLKRYSTKAHLKRELHRFATKDDLRGYSAKDT